MIKIFGQEFCSMCEVIKKFASYLPEDAWEYIDITPQEDEGFKNRFREYLRYSRPCIDSETDLLPVMVLDKPLYRNGGLNVFYGQDAIETLKIIIDSETNLW